VVFNSARLVRAGEEIELAEANALERRSAGLRSSGPPTDAAPPTA